MCGPPPTAASGRGTAPAAGTGCGVMTCAVVECRSSRLARRSRRPYRRNRQLETAARRLPCWHPHTDPGAIVAEEGQGDSRAAGVVDVPDGIPGFCRHARHGDVVGDDPEGQDIRDALVSDETAP